MMPTSVELPADFRSNLELSNAVDSSLHSVSSGIQTAQSVGLSHIADTLESFAACFPHIGTSPQPLHTLADAAGIASPDHYLNQAQQFAGKEGLKTFSNLTSMLDVFHKLSDPNFAQHKSLLSLSELFSKFQFPLVHPTDAGSSKIHGSPVLQVHPQAPEWKIHDAPHFKMIDAIEAKLGDAQHFKYGEAPYWKIDDARSEKLGPDIAFEDKWIPRDDGFTLKGTGDLRDIDPGFIPRGDAIGDKDLPGDAIGDKDLPGDAGDKWIPQDIGFTPRLDGTDSRDLDPGFAPPNIGGEQRDIDPGFIPTDTQKLSDFKSTLDQIVTLRQQLEEF